MPPFVIAAIALMALASHGALAQTSVPPALAVQRLAPQLVAFAGSPANFQNLVNGLSQGIPVQLVTALPGGVTQVVSFTPTTALSPVEVAQILETSRQQLIGLGIGSPTAEQLGIALVGGQVPTALGSTALPGAVSSRNNPPSPAAQMQSAATGASAPVTSVSTSGVSVQLFAPASPALAPAAIPGNLSDSPTPPGATSRSVVPSPSATPPIVTPVTVPGAAAAATPSAPERTAPTVGTPRH